MDGLPSRFCVVTNVTVRCSTSAERLKLSLKRQLQSAKMPVLAQKPQCASKMHHQLNLVDRPVIHSKPFVIQNCVSDNLVVHV